MKRAPRGFTLIELLISIVLMIILLGAVTMIFVRTTETVNIQEARTIVFTNARYALDMFENDFMGALSLYNPPPPPLPPPIQGLPPQPPPPPPPPNQAFFMENGYLAADGQLPSYNTGGGHTDKAGDRISFRATTGVGDSMQTVEVTYQLIPGNKCVDGTKYSPGATLSSANLPLKNGDESHRKTVRSGRGLYTLVRAIRAADPNTPNVYDKVAEIYDKGAGKKLPIVDTELAHYVVSFNLEYFANNQTYSQLEPPFPFTRADPLGDGKGINDLGPAPGPYRVPSIRATLVIVEDVAERQERTIQKVMINPAN